MSFNWKDFGIKQLCKEHNYIINTYFKSLKKIDNKKNEENKYTVSSIILNDNLYKLYSLDQNNLNILLIPIDSKDNSLEFDLKKDFNEVIRYNISDKGLHFSLMKKKNGLVTYKNYNFRNNELDYCIGIYFHGNFDDLDNQLEKEFKFSNKDFINFLLNFDLRNLFKHQYNLDIIKRNNIETKLNQIRADNLLDAYQAYDKKYKPIEDNETTVFELLEGLNKQKIKK